MEFIMGQNQAIVLNNSSQFTQEDYYNYIDHNANINHHTRNILVMETMLKDDDPTKMDYDANEHMSSYNYLEVEDGYKFVTHFDFLGMDGYAEILAMKEEDIAKIDKSDPYWHYKAKPVLSVVKPMDNEMGYLQYFFLKQYDIRFGLKGHANYGICRALNSVDQIRSIYEYFKKHDDLDENNDVITAGTITVKKKQLEEFKYAVPTIKVELNPGFCYIEWVGECEHGGVFRAQQYIQRQAPYIIEDLLGESLLRYKNGMRY